MKLILLLLISVLAWDQEGHLIIANIGYRNLPQNVMNKINNQSNIYFNFYPNISTPLEISSWLDEIKSVNNSYFNTWHYIDLPFNNHTNYPVKNYSNINLVFILKELINTYEKGTDLYTTGLNIRLLIHLIGDIHQPFHCITFYSPQFPNSDGGGNLYLAKYNKKKTNLHSFWDSCGELFNKNFPYPLSNNNINYINNITNILLSVYNNISYNKNINFDIWANESYNLAANYGYQNVVYNQKLSQYYINITRNICTERIVVAGQRLNSLLLNIFS